MPVKRSSSAIVVDRPSPVRKAKARGGEASAGAADHRQDTKELLAQIKQRGETLSAEIKELLVRMG